MDNTPFASAHQDPPGMFALQLACKSASANGLEYALLVIMTQTPARGNGQNDPSSKISRQSIQG
jgi:hypothetical protein